MPKAPSPPHTTPFPWLSAKVRLRQTGPGTSPVRRLGGRLELGVRFSDPVTVAVQALRPLGGWTNLFRHTGKDFGGLVKVGDLADVRIVVTGSGTGTVDLLQHRRK